MSPYLPSYPPTHLPLSLYLSIALSENSLLFQARHDEAALWEGRLASSVAAQATMDQSEASSLLSRAQVCWSLHDSAIANIVLCMAYKRRVGRGSYIAMQ